MTRTLVVSVAASLALAGCFTTPSDGPEPVLTPDAPTTTDDLVVQLVDGPIGEGVAISWYVDDAPVQSLQNLDTVPAGITAKGQTWRVVLSPIAFVGGGIVTLTVAYAVPRALLTASCPPSSPTPTPTSPSAPHASPSRGCCERRSPPTRPSSPPSLPPRGGSTRRC